LLLVSLVEEGIEERGTERGRDWRERMGFVLILV
jgi:hypothetical protein